MKSIEIFYHLYIPPDWKCYLWSQYIDNHIDLLKKSRLWNVSKFNLSICMPMHSTEIMGYPLTANNSNISLSFHKKIQEYVNLRYPEISILEIRDVSEHNLYEGQTLSWVWKTCQVQNCMVLYLHSKGISNYNPVATTDNWRQILDYFIIEKWDENIKFLSDFDVVGIKDKISSDLVLSGNFWWSTSEYIKKLPNPLDIAAYFPHPDTPERYAYERWITANKPKLYYVANTKTNHYHEWCFLENLLKG